MGKPAKCYFSLHRVLSAELVPPINYGEML